jgi:hypothetical protein
MSVIFRRVLSLGASSAWPSVRDVAKSTIFSRAAVTPKLSSPTANLPFCTPGMIVSKVPFCTGSVRVL